MATKTAEAQQMTANPIPQRIGSLPLLLVGTSTKMYFSHKQSMAYMAALLEIAFPSNVQLFYIPTFPSLAPCADRIEKSDFKPWLGAQDCCWLVHGAQTGSVSAAVLNEIGCTLVELGHAERKAPPYNEDDETISLKVATVVNRGMVPLICVGETSSPKSDSSFEVNILEAWSQVQQQIKSYIRHIHLDSHIVFAYEPVWAIGASNPADPRHVKEMIKKIKDETAYRNGDVRVLYGGSAGPGTWQNLKGAADGLFLGRFAHDVANLKKTVEEVGAQ